MLFLILKDFYKYVGVTEISIHAIYERFFEWVKNKKNESRLLQDHVILMKELDLSTNLLQVLKDLPFIEIGGKYHRANQCYDPSKWLFRFAYHNMILPPKYDLNDQRLKKLLLDLGLIVECTFRDYLNIVPRVFDEAKRKFSNIFLIFFFLTFFLIFLN